MTVLKGTKTGLAATATTPGTIAIPDLNTESRLTTEASAMDGKIDNEIMTINI